MTSEFFPRNRLIIDGFEFSFAPDGGGIGYDGLLLNADDEAFNDPAWIAALRKANALTIPFHKLRIFEYWGKEYQRKGYKWFPLDMLENCLEGYKQALPLRGLLDFSAVDALAEDIGSGIQEERQKEAQKRDRQQRKDERLGKPGYVYLLRSANGHFKIGKSENPKTRIAGIMTQSPPGTVEQICIIPAENMHALEKALHATYADKRAQGEWFSLDADDVATIKRLAERES